MIDLVLNHTSTEHPWFKKRLLVIHSIVIFTISAQQKPMVPLQQIGFPNSVVMLGKNCLTPLSTICIYTMLLKLI